MTDRYTKLFMPPMEGDNVRNEKYAELLLINWTESVKPISQLHNCFTSILCCCCCCCQYLCRWHRHFASSIWTVRLFVYSLLTLWTDRVRETKWRQYCWIFHCHHFIILMNTTFLFASLSFKQKARDRGKKPTNANCVNTICKRVQQWK